MLLLGDGDAGVDVTLATDGKVVAMTAGRVLGMEARRTQHPKPASLRPILRRLV